MQRRGNGAGFAGAGRGEFRQRQSGREVCGFHHHADERGHCGTRDQLGCIAGDERGELCDSQQRLRNEPRGRRFVRDHGDVLAHRRRQRIRDAHGRRRRGHPDQCAQWHRHRHRCARLHHRSYTGPDRLSRHIGKLHGATGLAAREQSLRQRRDAQRDGGCLRERP